MERYYKFTQNLNDTAARHVCAPPILNGALSGTKKKGEEEEKKMGQRERETGRQRDRETGRQTERERA